jgi:hypothetical protein
MQKNTPFLVSPSLSGGGLLSTLGVLTQECQGRCPSRSPLGAAACPQTPCRQPANDEVNDLFNSWVPADPAQAYVPHLQNQEPVLIYPRFRDEGSMGTCRPPSSGYSPRRHRFPLVSRIILKIRTYALVVVSASR